MPDARHDSRTAFLFDPRRADEARTARAVRRTRTHRPHRSHRSVRHTHAAARG
ncbi:MAG: hypothetical protein U0R68_09415 [Candidatus Nanopelagicales bacterium]